MQLLKKTELYTGQCQHKASKMELKTQNSTVIKTLSSILLQKIKTTESVMLKYYETASKQENTK